MFLQIIEPMFPLGEFSATQALLDALGEHAEEALQMAITRHSHCDWGELDEHDRQVNDNALWFGSQLRQYGGRLLSAYDHEGRRGTVRFWIITEADRSLTTALLPRDY